MLVLTHEVGSSVTVGATTITVLSIKGKRLRLGYTGPDQVVRNDAKTKTSKPPKQPKK